MYKLVVNKIRCKFCGDIIESRGVHDFVRCRCGKCSTDGGREYAQRSFFTENPEDTYEDLSIYVNTETNEIVPASDAAKEDIPFKPIRVEIKKVEVPDEPKVIEAEAEPEEDPGPDVEIKDFNGWTYEATMKDEPEEEKEVVVKKDKNGKPVSGRYPYGNKK